MTVLENLLAGAYLQKDKEKSRETLGKVYEMFPVLRERSRQISGTLSGGEQQMLAIGRALMSEPKLLCIDEPSTGLAPLMRKEVFEKIVEVKNLGITILLVEQEVSTVFKLASRNYVLSSGKMIADRVGRRPPAGRNPPQDLSGLVTKSFRAYWPDFPPESRKKEIL